MRRYFPDGSQEKSGSRNVDGVRRLRIQQWNDLWNTDAAVWFDELRDRPRRFDAHLWQRAVLAWRNEVPARVDRTTPSLLEGVPFLVKDLYDVPGERTTCGSEVLLGNGSVMTDPESQAGPLVSIFRDAGSHLVGRTAMNEFAYGLDGRNSYTGDCPHPLSAGRIPGGSSSGSAWAVAAGVVPFALGTDTGGSIRLPAAMCGIYGIRMSWSAEWLRGVFPLARTMDTVGWFTAVPGDMQILLQLVLQSERQKGNVESRQPGLKTSVKKTPEQAAPSIEKIGAVIPPGIRMDQEMLRLWRALLERLQEAGFAIEAVKEEELLGDGAVDAYNVIGSSEAWEVHREWIESHGELYDPVVRGLIERGRHWSTERRQAAEDTRNQVRRYAKNLFDRFDVLLLPATTMPTPLREQADGTFRSQILRLNTLASLAGLPALSIPLHHDAVRSGGFQVLAPVGEEIRFDPFLQRWQEILS